MLTEKKFFIKSSNIFKKMLTEKVKECILSILGRLPERLPSTEFFHEMRLTMKRLVSLLAAAVLLCTSVAAVSAAGVSDWTAGTGFQIDGKNSPVTITQTKDGIQGSWGGFYANGANWGGMVYNEKLTLDGLEIVLRIDKLPELTADFNTWISIDFVANKDSFYTSGDFVKNPGIVNLWRWAGANGKPGSAITINNYGPDKWSGGSSCVNNVPIEAAKAGDTVTVKVSKDSDGKYALYINGTDVNPTKHYDLSEVMPDGKGYFLLMASEKHSVQDDFQFTVLSINGESLAPAPETTAAPVTSAPTTTPAAPATADSSVLYMVLAAAAVSVLVVVAATKKKTAQN